MEKLSTVPGLMRMRLRETGADGMMKGIYHIFVVRPPEGMRAAGREGQWGDEQKDYGSPGEGQHAWPCDEGRGACRRRWPQGLQKKSS